MLKGKNVNAKVVKNVTKNKNMVKNLEREEGDLPPPRSWSGKDVKSFFKPRNKAKVRNYKPMKVIYAETGNMKDNEREEILKQKGIFNAAYDSNLFLRKKLKTRMEEKDTNAEQIRGGWRAACRGATAQNWPSQIGLSHSWVRGACCRGSLAQTASPND